MPLSAAAAVAAITAGAVAVATLGPGDRGGAGRTGPAAAGARLLSFTRHGRFIDVIVRNPAADPQRYRAEFRAHHLDITLSLVPVSPSLVGTVVFVGASQQGGAITPITARGRCTEASGTGSCPVGLRVPAGYRGSAQLVFGRAARPGEQYESTAPATARGEVMHGMHFRGRTVAVVLAMLRRRHVTVPVFHYLADRAARLLRPAQVPLSWYVYGADPWAPRQVALWAGPARKPAASITPMPSASPARPAPRPSPGRTRSAPSANPSPARPPPTPSPGR